MTKGANNKDVRLELRMTSKDKARIEAKAKKEIPERDHCLSFNFTPKREQLYKLEDLYSS